MGFMQDHEVALCKEFHRAAPEKKLAVATKFTNIILQEQAIRLLGRHYQEHLSSLYLERYQQYLTNLHQSNEQTVAQDYRGEPRVTSSKALSETESLLSNPSLTSRQQNLLKELKKFLYSANR